MFRQHYEKMYNLARCILSDDDESKDMDERLEQLLLLIDNLEPPIRKLIFRLRYLQEKSYQEVADEVGVSKVTVFKHLSKALDWLINKAKQ